MNKVLISVVLPVYNVEKYLGQCLDSLLGQSLKETEIICVDDGSTDHSLEILECYSQKDERIKIIRQKNMYAGVARNNGMKEATGEYILFLDSDDFFETDMLETMYKQAKLVKADICVCGGRVYNDRDGTFKEAGYYLRKEMIPDRSFFSPDDIEEYIFNFVTPAPWTKLFRLEYIKAEGFYFQNTQRTNDLFFVYNALVNATRITTVLLPFVNYRTGTSTSLQATNVMSPFDFYEALKLLRKELYRRKKYRQFEKSYKNLALDTCVYNLKKAGDYDSFAVICEKLKNEIFFDLELIGHTRAYFHQSANFSLLLDIMGKSTQDVWESQYELKHKISEDIFPLFDINGWRNPLDLSTIGPSVKISVVIPVYNVEKYLRECLDSVINQTLRQIEIICVNDGSPDLSGEILREYAEKDSRIRIIDKENGGLSSARNAGLDVANGEYVYFIDSDDMIDDRALEFMYVKAKEDNLDQLYFSSEVFCDGIEGEEYEKYKNYYIRKYDYSQLVAGKDLFKHFVENAEFKPSVPLQLHKRSFLEENQIRFMPGLIHEDQLFTMQSLFFAKRVRYENVNLYKRRIREGSIMTGGANFRSAYSMLKIVEEMRKFAQEKEAGRDQEYFYALLIQLNRLCDNARDKVSQIHPEVLKEKLQNLSEEEQIDFRFYIYMIMDLKRRLGTESKRANRLAENTVVYEYKWRNKYEKLNNKYEKLKDNYNELSEKDDENLRQIKDDLTITTLKLAQIENSISYRVGRMITMIPRKLRNIIHKF